MRHLAAQGKPVPALDSKPRMPPDLVDMVEAFGVLNQSRPPSQSTVPAAIPLSEIVAYLSLFRDTDPERFVRLIQAMDVAWRETYAKQNSRPKR